MRDNVDHARAWMLKGDSDLLTVRHLLDTNGPYDTACFHAQQAAEKYLKALLALTGRPIPLIHIRGEASWRGLIPTRKIASCGWRHVLTAPVSRRRSTGTHRRV